jgi:hypothetical protein
MNNTWM